MDINKITNIHTKNWHEQPIEKLKKKKKKDFQVIFHCNRTANTGKRFCGFVCVYAHTFTYTFISGVLKTGWLSEGGHSAEIHNVRV